jgi:hypothetical protein
MDAYLLVDETIRIAWQGDDIAKTVRQWRQDGYIGEHYSADGESTLVIHWGNVRSLRLDKFGQRLRG